MTRAQLIAGLVAVLITLAVIELVRRRKLSEEFSLLWILASFGVVTLAFWGGLLTGITRAIGALYETSTMFFFGQIFLMAVLLYYAVKISSLTQEVRELAQETALLRFRLEQGRRADPGGVGGKEERSG